MSFDLAKAFTCFKEDPQYIKKLVTATVITLLSIIGIFISGLMGSGENINAIALLVGLTICLVLGMYLNGFIFRTGEIYVNQKSKNMANFGEKNLLLYGVKATIACLLYSSPFVLISLLPVLFIAIASAGKQDTAALLLIPVLFIIPLVALVICGLLMPSAMIFFFKTGKITSVFSYSKFIKIYKKNISKMWILLLLTIVASSCISFVAQLLIYTIIGALLFPALTIYTYIVCFNLYAQFAEEINIEQYL